MRLRELLCLSLFAGANTCFSQPADAPWPMVRYDRWGTAKQPVGPDPSTMRTPWLQRRLGGGDLVSHSPAIAANGVVYFGSWLTNLMRKMDSNTGALLGSFDALEWIKSSPALGADGSVFFNVPKSIGAIAGRVYSVNSSTMDFNWFATTNNTSGSNDHDNGSPILGPDESVLTGAAGGAAYRYLPNGSLVWSKTGLSAVKLTFAMTRDDSKVLVPNGTKLTALNFTDGTVAWTFSTASSVGSPGVAADGTIIVGTDAGLVYGISPVDGSTIWTSAASGIIRGGPAFSGDSAYICSYGKRLYSFKVSDGTEEWSVLTNQELRQGPIVGADNRVYCNGVGGEITSVSSSGQVVWQINTTHECRNSMSMDDKGRLFVPDAGYGGVMVVSQAYFDVPPITVSLPRGIYVSGSVGDLNAVDQNYYRARNGLTTGQFDPPIQIVLDVNAPATSLAALDLKLVSAASTPNLTQRIEAFNWSANAYYVLDTTTAKTVDTERMFSVVNPSRFINSTLGMRFRVSYIPAGLIVGSNYQVRLDAAKFVSSPAFVP